MRRRGSVLATTATVLGLLFGLGPIAPATADGAGGPAAFFLRPDSVRPPGGGPSVKVKRTGTATTVEHGGEQLTVNGRYAIPAIAFDESATGLSADGETLVLRKIVPVTGSGYPSKSAFAIVSTDGLQGVRTFTLPGVFSVDAVSPDGSHIYFIEYSRQDPTRYAVRAYDTATGRLLPKPIVDPSEHEGEMRGLPATRVYSPDGRWAYTLYRGGDQGPFVHALDTVEGRARCIDLPHLDKGGNHSPEELGLGSGGRELRVLTYHEEPLAHIDTATFKVSRVPPQTRTPSPSPAAGSNPSSSGEAWVLAAGALAALGAAWLAFKRRSARPAG